MENNDIGVSVLYLDKIGTLVIKKTEDSGFFLASENSIVISKSALVLLVKQLIASGILEELK